MEKTFDQFTDNDWLEFAKYINTNDKIYDEIVKHVNNDAKSLLLSINLDMYKPKQNKLVWTMDDTAVWKFEKFSINKDYPYLKIEKIFYLPIFKYYLANETIGINIKTYINDDYNYDKSFLQPCNNIGLNISIDFTKCNYEETTDIETIVMQNYFDYKAMYHIRSLIFDKCNNNPYNIYTTFETSIEYIYFDLMYTYIDAYDDLRNKIDKYINIVKLYPDALKNYIPNNFNWTTEFEGDKIVSVKFE